MRRRPGEECRRDARRRDPCRARPASRRPRLPRPRGPAPAGYARPATVVVMAPGSMPPWQFLWSFPALLPRRTRLRRRRVEVGLDPPVQILQVLPQLVRRRPPPEPVAAMDLVDDQ